MNTHNIRRALDEAIESDIRRQREAGSRKNAYGHYWQKVNGVLVSVDAETPLVDANTLPLEGIIDLLDTWLGSKAKEAAWYVGLYATEISPAANWTAANIVATAGEITSQSEGYSGANRPQYVPGAASSASASAAKVDNIGTEASYAIVATGAVNVAGAFIVSAQARGATTGVLASAARYNATRVLQNGDTYEVGYRVTITGT
jgi:hypothetical protein